LRGCLREGWPSVEPFPERITFHLSLEDKLLQEFGGPIQPILEKLGMSADEPITHSMVTRAIKNAQEKKGG
jgi:preprotein translocase subunit SecA